MLKRMILLGVTVLFAMVGAGIAVAGTIPERLMTDLQKDFGLTDFQAAGIVGNLALETGNFRQLQEIAPLKGSRGGIGYAQWTGKRRTAFETYANGADLTTYDVNYGFLVMELSSGSESKVIKRIVETKTLEQASRIFMLRFLRPHKQHRNLGRRISHARAYLSGDFSEAGCQEIHEVKRSGRKMIISACPEPDVAQGKISPFSVFVLASR